MASSPTSSCRSSFSTTFPASSSSDFSELPVSAMKDKIVEKILGNRVTLIVGETGCGKSSQIPQFLLEENMGPILCTQPRRFAVVAVARMVARTRNCEVGGEVGYHIGHSRVFSARSKIVFKTAGVLLDEMRENGLKALKYKVIVLDEVHERSVESDLVLVCIKQFLHGNNDLRVVLMSATANISRYRDYFKDLHRNERIEVLAIPSTGRNTFFQKKVYYLEQVAELLGKKSEDLSLEYCSGPSPSMAKADLKNEVHNLIHDLVIHIHKNEPDIEKAILIFLPTYYALEQQWNLLKRFNAYFKIHILHSSIDTERALKSMKICKSHRKVILATNIAESSVTIPKVGYVIDSCRSLQVFWDGTRKADGSELVWVSKSQAEQRKGRTGRTCDGVVYRLVTGPFYGKLEDYESPAMLKLSLRQQVLLICCAQSKVINEPRALLQKAMDPPEPDVVEAALDLLIQIRALERASTRGRHEPTFYGRLLSSFSLSFDASVLILKFGEIGMIREGILFGILMDLQPLPIMHPFGQDRQFMEYIDSYYNGNDKNTGLGRKEVLLMANFCAYQFWQHAYKDKFCLGQLTNICKLDETEDLRSLIPELEEEWCSLHYLVLPAIRQLRETYDEIINTMHRFRPKSLVISSSAPLDNYPFEFQHICHLMSQQNNDSHTTNVGDNDIDQENDLAKCVSVPFVGPYDFQKDDLARTIASVVKEMRIHLIQDVSIGNNIYSPNYGHLDSGGPPLCRYFVNGSCNRGSQCSFSHSIQAKRPVCKFFLSLQGCRNGESCFFSHDSNSSAKAASESSCYHPEDSEADAEYLLQFFPNSSDGYILLLDDVDLHFSSHFVRQCDPSCIISTIPQIETVDQDPLLTGIKVLSGLGHPYQTILCSGGNEMIPWSEVRCVLWFPQFGNDYGDVQKSLLSTFFNYLAIRILADALDGVQVILTLNNTRFSQLQVEKLAMDSFFFLKYSFPYDEASFGRLYDDVAPKRPMVISLAVSYVFELHPPTGILLDEHRTTFQKFLCSLN